MNRSVTVYPPTEWEGHGFLLACARCSCGMARYAPHERRRWTMGPGARIRQRAGAGFWGRLLDCFYCLSLWVSAPLAVILGNSAKEGLLLWLALSAGAILFERITAEQPSQASALYFEEQEDRDVLR
jgi:hypothetical protein